jgi:TonB family protein
VKNNSTTIVVSQVLRHRVVALFAVVAGLTLFSSSPVRGQSAKDAAALFAKALAVSDIRAPGSLPFELQATIDIEQPHHEPPIEGKYLLKWLSPEKWREEIHFANYTRIRVGGKGQYWQSRTTPAEIQPILELDQAMDFLKELHVWAKPEAIANLSTVKLHQEKIQGAKSDCVALTLKGQYYSPNYCFDRARGVLVLDRGSLNEFSTFTLFAGKLFPGNIRVKEESSGPVAFVVNSISPLANADPNDFEPASDSTAWPSCDNPGAMPGVIRSVAPIYPDSEKFNHRQGTVFTYAVIGVDGRLHNLQVLGAPDKGLADSALTAMEQWEYAPETCHGTPVPVEILVPIHFDLE